MNSLYIKSILSLTLILSLWFFSIFFSSPTNIIHTFDGNRMTIDYHIMVEIPKSEQQLIIEIINNTFNEVDQIYNNWNTSSEITILNNLKANEVIEISPEMENFLKITEVIVKLSDGYFDPTIEPLHRLWKKHLEIGMTPTRVEIDNIMPVIGWKNIHFEKGKFFKDYAKTSLDMGGIAKGYCVDLLVERIVAAGYHNVFVEWGGEIRTHGRHSAGRPWKVFVGRLDDMDPQNAIVQIELDNQSIATSGDYIQNWSIGQKDSEIIYFHIINPKTAKPLESTSSSVASATVIAPSCVLADALATIAMMNPSIEEARNWAEQISKQDPRIKFWLIAREESSSAK